MLNPLALLGILSVVALLAVSTLAFSYRFIPDKDEIFGPCEGLEADYLAKSVDLSQLEMKRSGDKLSFSGQSQWLWELDEKDNIDLRIETQQLKKGRYSPTPWQWSRKNACKALFNSSEPWYQWFTEYIYEEDHMCPTMRPKLIWRYHPFELSLLVHDAPIDDLAGHYKVHLYVVPVDNRSRPKKFYLCTQLLGEVQKA